MKIATTKTVKDEREIPVPCFFQYDNYKYIGVFSETDYRSIFILGQRTYLVSDTPDGYDKEILEAIEKWEPITEEEFMTKYNAVLKSLSLEPTLIEK